MHVYLGIKCFLNFCLTICTVTTFLPSFSHNCEWLIIIMCLFALKCRLLFHHSAKDGGSYWVRDIHRTCRVLWKLVWNKVCFQLLVNFICWILIGSYYMYHSFQYQELHLCNCLLIVSGMYMYIHGMMDCFWIVQLWLSQWTYQLQSVCCCFSHSLLQ